jgi:hypothetical protein
MRMFEWILVLLLAAVILTNLTERLPVPSCDLRVNEYTASQKGLLGRPWRAGVIRQNENPA